jgi:hypothetical protein
MMMGITMFISLLFLASWIPAEWKRRLVGFGFATDIAVHVILQTLFGGDAEGRVGMLFAGVLFNCAMHLYRKLFGYETLSGDMDWVRHPGMFNKGTS